VTIDERFAEWMDTRDGQAVYAEFVRRALLLQARGRGHYGADAIIQAIRYDYAIRLDGDGAFRINDHYTSRLARLAMREVPQLRGMFDLRELHPNRVPVSTT
jgi:hypothetical protein